MNMENIDQSYHSDLKTAIDYLKSIGCSEIYLFGSLVESSAHADSDIDIAVRGIQAKDFFFVYGELMTRVRHKVDLIDLDLQKEFGARLEKVGSLKRVA